MSFTVQAFGSNGSGQLALCHTDDVSQPANCVFADGKPNSLPVKIAAGGNHTLLLCEDGSLYAAGENGDGRCGIEASNKPLTSFHRVRFTSDSGTMIDHFKLIAATWETSAFVTFDGQVFTSGSGSSGELGQGESHTRCLRPRVIPGFPPQGTNVIDFAACMRHTVVVLSSGEVFGWGAGRKGQLGEPKAKVIWSPRKIEPFTTIAGDPWEFKALRAVCCRDFTYVLGPPLHESSSNRCYSIHGTENGEDIISLAPHPAPACLDVAATWRGIHVLVGNGRVWGWGYSRVPVESPPIKAVAAGSEHILVETVDGKILASGWGEHGNCGKPLNEESEVEGWNEIGPGQLLGAGCATSWILAGTGFPFGSVEESANLWRSQYRISD